VEADDSVLRRVLDNLVKKNGSGTVFHVDLPLQRLAS